MDQAKEQLQDQPTTPKPEIVEQKLSSEQNYPKDYELTSRQSSNNNLYYLIISVFFLIVLSIASLFLTGVISF
jgi:hypothetical protein